MSSLTRPILILISLSLSACGGGSGSAVPNAVINVPTVKDTGTLNSIGNIAQGADACGTLEATIKAMAVSQMQMQFASYTMPSLSSPGLIEDGVPSAVYPTSSVTSSGTTATAAPTATSDSAYSTTTSQYASVDEMDWVKNDGRFLWTFLPQNGNLVLSKAALTPATAMQRVAQSQWPQNPQVNGLYNWLSPQGLFLLGNGQLASVTSGGMSYGIYWSDVAIAGAMTPVYPGPWASVQPYTEVRVHDGSSLATLHTYTIKGSLLAARHLSGSDALIFVTEAPVVWPAAIKWYPDLSGVTSQADLAQKWPALVQSTLAANQALIAAQPLATWLGQDTPPSAAECASYSRVDAADHLALTRITTINPVAQTSAQAVVLTEGAGVYVSSQSLVLSTRRWTPSDGNPWQDAWTDLHRFALDGNGVATYQASGKIAGWLLNRFAMDEVQQNGRTILRMAVSNRSITTPAPNFATQPYSYLVNLEQKDGALVQTAISGPIASGESLQAARFVGDKAYLVTFKVVDPFFIYDLSNPDQIVAQGQLLVPGYSTYLSPVSDTLVFGIGLDSGTWPRRVKASLFDVSNPAAPVELGTQVLGDSYSWSEALWEPHALTFYPVKAADGSAATLVGVPVGTDIKLLNLSAGGGVSLLGAMTPGNSPYDYARRSVFIGNNVYGLSQNSVLGSAAIAAPAVPLGSLSLLP